MKPVEDPSMLILFHVWTHIREHRPWKNDKSKGK